LAKVIVKSLENLTKAMDGLIPTTGELDAIANALYDNLIPM
jgi:hypothetical protein